MTVLAVWGAALSTILALSQAIVALYRRRPHVRVKIGTEVEGNALEGDEWFVVAVSAVNHGTRPVQIESVGWFTLEHPERRYPFDYEAIRKRLPKTINPWEMLREAILEEDVAANPKRPIAGWVRLATGEVICSESIEL